MCFISVNKRGGKKREGEREGRRHCWKYMTFSIWGCSTRGFSPLDGMSSHVGASNSILTHNTAVLCIETEAFYGMAWTNVPGRPAEHPPSSWGDLNDVCSHQSSTHHQAELKWASPEWTFVGHLHARRLLWARTDAWLLGYAILSLPTCPGLMSTCSGLRQPWLPSNCLPADWKLRVSKEKPGMKLRKPICLNRKIFRQDLLSVCMHALMYR